MRQYNVQNHKNEILLPNVFPYVDLLFHPSIVIDIQHCLFIFLIVLNVLNKLHLNIIC